MRIATSPACDADVLQGNTEAGKEAFFYSSIQTAIILQRP